MPRALVLLLENDPDLRDALTLLLESWGLEVLACPGTAEALELLAETGLSPDVLLADYQLDGTDLGSAAIRAIRARHGPCPACVITASRSGDIPAACQELEAALLHKPIDPAALRRFLQASLGTGQG
jgi:CheY-like chemotaxis protein